MVLWSAELNSKIKSGPGQSSVAGANGLKMSPVESKGYFI